MNDRNGPSYTVLMVCITVVVCFIGAACVAVFLAAPEGANTFSLVAILLGVIPSTVASLVALVSIKGVSAQVTAVQSDTDALTNGLGLAQARTAVADVLPPGLVDPNAHSQLAADRTRINEHARD